LNGKIDYKKIIMLTIAGIVNAFGVTMFLKPVCLYDSGISGTAMLVAQVTPGYISLSLCLLVLNIPLFLYGLKRQGKVFTICAIYTVFVYSAFAWLITDIFSIDVSAASPLAGTDLLLCAVFGGIISGTGSGLAIRYGGAIDGIEVMAVIFAKRLGISVGTFVMAYNLILYIACGIIMRSWILPLYSIITYMVAIKAVDFIVEGLDRAKSAMIITDKPDAICEKLSSAFETGSTKIDAVGGYSNSSKTVVYFVVNRFQVTKMKDIVHNIDPNAYITISEVADVFANNWQGNN
jgi:uncharacterized membrane-anchored protein YitT (DUF2179 family)